MRRLAPDRLAFAILMASLLILHLVSAFTENVNWDEFALLARAADTLATGTLQSGGRPGLATLILIPFVADCANSIEAVRASRLLWTGFTVALVSGFWVLLAQLLEGARGRAHRVALGVALLVLVPVFLKFSIQVRTDQPAIAFGLWGGVALLASRRNALWALPAGILLGIGFLFSQKLMYVAALVGLLVAGDLLLRRDLKMMRELGRVALCGAGGLAVLVAYRLIVTLFFEPGRLESFSGGMSTFAHYRADFGFGFYGLMLPTLLAHFVLLALLLNATLRRDRDDDPRNRSLLLAWAVLALGTVVMLFHAAALPYFWMTLGLFPAAGIAIGFDSIRDFFARERERRIVVGSVWAFLIVQAALTAGVLLKDTQRAQRESLAFIDRNFTGGQQGYHPERALFCRDSGKPFRTVSAAIVLKNRFWGAEREEQGAELMRQFGQRPVAFMLDSFRLRQFPPEIRAFWRANYRLYYESVWLPALAVEGSGGTLRDLVVLVPGTYRLDAPGGGQGPSIRLDGEEVEPGGLIELESGSRRLELLEDMEGGSLIFVVEDPPTPQSQPFYKPLQVIGFLW